MWYGVYMKNARENGFLPLSTTELEQLKAELSGSTDGFQLRFTLETVGRLLATVEWYQDRETNIATALCNSRAELDVLFAPADLDTIPVLDEEPTNAEIQLDDVDLDFSEIAA